MYRNFHSINNRKSQAFKSHNGIVNVTYSKLAVIFHVHYRSLGDDHTKLCQKSLGLPRISQLQESCPSLNAKAHSPSKLNYAGIL